MACTAIVRSEHGKLSDTDTDESRVDNTDSRKSDSYDSQSREKIKKKAKAWHSRFGHARSITSVHEMV